MAEKASTPRGTRDFGPKEMVRRNYIFETIKKHFKNFGFEPIETPSMELTKTLMGKYGDEGDKLIFRILNSGNYLENVNFPEDNDQSRNKFSNSISEKALRYDLTVPFARFVVQHQNDITFPFKRYQIQPVWRADRPAKGRYREFFQCDADIIGSNSLLNELELILLMDRVFTDLKINTTIKINNRKILSGIADITNENDHLIDITVAIDKLDKIGEAAVLEEMRTKGVSETAIEKIKPLLSLGGDIEAQLKVLESIFSNCEIGKKGIEELRFLFTSLQELDLKSAMVELDITLARGLNYYTGAIFEVKSNEGELKISITGGGRYDDLTGIFGLPNMSGVGISFGADRIYDVLNDLNKFPEETNQSLKIVFVNFGDKEAMHCLKLIEKLRAENIASELYPDSAKMNKQMKYANDKNIPFVGLIGSAEMESGKITLKNMHSGEQSSVSMNELIEKLK